MLEPRDPSTNDPVIAFLDAADEVTNGNTFLLTYEIDKRDNISQSLKEFLQSSEFAQKLVEADRQREWFNFAQYNPETGEYKYPSVANSSILLKDNFELTLTELTGEAIEQKLISLLTSTKSPYQKQLSKDKAQVIVSNFLKQLVTNHHDGQSSENCRYFEVKPDFLNETGYYNSGQQLPANKLTYFDGGHFDGCLLIECNNTLILLLTNGSP